MKYKYLIIGIYAIIASACSGQEFDKKLIEQNWISDLNFNSETNQLDYNTILMLRQDYSTTFELGKQNKPFKFNYNINGELLSLGQNLSPMKIVKLDSNKMILNINETDTVEFNSFNIAEFDKNVILDKIRYHTFELVDNKNSIRYLIHFEENELLIFSNDLPKENIDFPNLSFTRVKYRLSFIEGIPAIVIFGKLKRFDYPIIGLISLAENQIHVRTYLNKKVYITKMNSINKNTDLVPSVLIDKWTLGAGKNKQTFEFKKDGELIYTAKEEIKYWKWSIDESGYLITMIDENGNRKYGIKNFKTANRRIGYELMNGRFSDMLNIK